MLNEYFKAFANLYGIIKVRKALDIIRKQNKEFTITEEELTEMKDNLFNADYDFVDKNYFNEEEISLEDSILEDEIVHEIYLYSFNDQKDDDEDYRNLKIQQANKPFYIPPKEELLKYADEMYIEKSASYLSFKDYLTGKLKITNADELIDEMNFLAKTDEKDMGYVIDNFTRISGYTFNDIDEINEFMQHLMNFFNNTRRNSNRGYTPIELNELMPNRRIEKIQIGPNMQQSISRGNIDAEEFKQMLSTSDLPPHIMMDMLDQIDIIKSRKIGRNDPCPCGSGKKYKQCCGKTK